MYQVKRFDSIQGIPEGGEHYDSAVFPCNLSWYRLLERHVFTGTSQIVAYRAFDSANVQSVTLPLLRLPSGRIGSRRITALQNYYTPDYRPICTSKSAIGCIDALVGQILQKEHPDVMTLSPVESDSIELVELCKSLASRGYFTDTRQSSINWIHKVEGSYEQYIAGRPSRLRNTLKRRSRQLLSLPGISIKISNKTSELPKLIAAYNEVYERSWKVSEPHTDFMPALINQTGEAQQLRLGLVSIAERPIAVHFWIVKGGYAYIFKLAHDREFDKFSPGTVLMAEMMRHVIDKDRVSLIDFLTGDDTYKRDWMSERRFKTELRAYNKSTVRGLCALGLDHYIIPFLNLLRNSFVRMGSCKNHSVERTY